jgi:hypothetical protein
MARSKRINIFGLLIIVLGVAASLIYYTGLTAPSVPETPRIYPDLLEFNTMSLDFSVLERESFENLRTFGDIPVRPGATGRENIFAPY